ncbi:MAG: DUF2062 domain-containing protein [Coraliomargarita sp.]|nr:DUF2062 domain-containing protein [Coraliomargarita sp.]
MTVEEHEFRTIKTRRIRRVKKWLRPLPRRANIHRYPVLHYFSDAAKKRSYLWSFRVENAVPAIYVGCVLALMPLYGIQLPLALIFALLLRANLPILAALQMVSNPFTVIPIWFSLYQIGKDCLGLIGIEALPLSRNDVSDVMHSFNHGDWSSKFDRILTVFGLTSFGAVIIGVFFGVILSTIYRLSAQRTANSYHQLKERIDARKHRKQNDSPTK